MKLTGKLKASINTIQKQDLIVLPRLESWLLTTGSEWKLSDESAEWFRQQVAKPSRDRTGSFSASSAGKCLRKQVFSFYGIEGRGELDTRLWNIFTDGHWRHGRLQTQLYEANIIRHIGIDTEVPIASKDRLFRGTMDAVGDSGGFIIEIKGANDRTFKWVISRGAPTEEHLFQGAAYSVLSGITTVVFLYENKNDQTLKEFVVDYTSFDWSNLILEQQARMKILKAAVTGGPLPQMLSEYPKKECSSCVFKKICPTGLPTNATPPKTPSASVRRKPVATAEKKTYARRKRRA